MPSNRASPSRVPSHKYLSRVCTMAVTVFWGSPASVPHERMIGIWAGIGFAGAGMPSAVAPAPDTVSASRAMTPRIAGRVKRIRYLPAMVPSARGCAQPKSSAGYEAGRGPGERGGQGETSNIQPRTPNIECRGRGRGAGWNGGGMRGIHILRFALMSLDYARLQGFLP